MKFREWNLDERLIKGIEEAGYADCMPVQEQSLAYTLQGRDVLVQSQTGSGKTATFVVSVFQLFLQRNNGASKALVIVPTRELAVQIEEEAKLLGKYLDFKVASFYGGVGYANQEKLLREGVDIIIGTPGRLIDLQQSGKYSLKDIDILIIDEADRLFDMGFLPDIRRMLKKMKPAGERHTMLFSATINSKVRQLVWEHMNEPADICLSPESVTVEGITQELFHVGRAEKMSLLIGLLRKMNPGSALIFTNTKQAAYEVSQRLELNGFKSKYIIGDLPQSKRLKTIDDMKSGRIPFLVATDVAARGLHIDDLELVVNYDLPEDCESYVHRIGRTARAGKTGKAISLACEQYVYGLNGIEDYVGFKLPVVWAEDSMFAEDVSRDKSFRLDRGKSGSGGEERRQRRRSGGKGKASLGQREQKRRRPKAAVGAAKRKTLEALPLQQKTLKTKQMSPSSNASIEKRVKYYSRKYGEKFTVPKEYKSERVQKASFISKIKNFFRRKQ